MATAHLMTINLVSALLAYGATGQVCTTKRAAMVSFHFSPQPR
jgi:hypothetical protein